MARRRGSIALVMLDQSVAPSLKSVLSNVIPPSEDATLQVVDSLVTAAVWKNHLHTLDQMARICGAELAAAEVMRALAATNDFLGKDEGECGLKLADLKDDEPLPFEIDVRARGRIGTHAQSISPAAAAAAAAEIFSDFEEMQTNSRASSSAVDREATQTSNKRKASAFSSSETKHPFALEMAPDSLNASALFLPLAAPAATAVAPSAPTVAAPTSGRSDREPPGLGGGGGAPRGCAPVSREGDGEPAGHGKGGALTGGAPLSGRVDRRSAEQAGGGAASLGDAPLLTALTVKTVAELGPAAQMAQATRTSVSAGRVRGSLSRRSSNAHGQATSRTEVSSNSSSRTKPSVSPAMAALFFMADRRGVGWLSVTDIQDFLEYHGQKKWASASRIRSMLTDLGISKTGNDPIKQSHFARLLLNLVQRDPFMDFSSRPLPPNESMAGIERQARELAAILKETEGRDHAKPTVARRRLNRALTSTAAAQAFGSGGRGGGGIEGVGEEDVHDRPSSQGRDQASHQVALEVAIRDLAASRHRSTVPGSIDSRGHRRPSAGHKTRGGGRGRAGGGGGGRGRRGVGLPLSSNGTGIPRGGQGLEAFLSLDHSVQASLVDAEFEIRPGVTVQESGLPDGAALGQESRATAEVLRSKSGPATMPVPGRLSRTAYKALSQTRTAPELPVGAEPPATAAGVLGQGDSAKYPLRDAVGRVPGGAGRGMAKGGRPSTAPVGLRGYLGKTHEADPRLLGGSKVSNGFDGGDGQPGYNNGGSSRRPSTSTSMQRHRSPGLRARAAAAGSVDSDPDGLPPFFVGEEAGRSPLGGGVGVKGSERHALIPRGDRRASSARGASRARVSSPGLGVRRDRRGSSSGGGGGGGGGRGRAAVAAW